MRQRPLYFVALALLVLAFGCSSGGNSEDSAASKASSDKSTTTTMATTTTIKPPKGATGGDLKAFCAAYHDVQQLGYGDFTKGTPAQQQAAIRAQYTKVGEAGKRMLAAAPREIKHAVDVAMKINARVVSSGSVKPFDSEENKQNGPLVAAYADQQCKATS